MTAIGQSHPYASFIHRVEKPARYVGGEYRSIIKKDARLRMCLAFPDVYDIGMSHLGTKILYGVINKLPDVALERAYTPWPDMERELRAHELPLLSLESALPLVDFDVVGFSLQYELTYTNLLTMLDLGGIPLRSEGRTLAHPIVLAGGPCATHPEPLAPFIDAFLVGDAEEALPTLLARLMALRERGASRLEQLLGIAGLPGVYVPSLYDTEICERSGLMVVGRPLHPNAPERVERALLLDINKFPFPSDSPEPVAEAIFDRVSVEIARGCTEGCRFCQAGMIYRPVRERDPEQIVDTIVAAVEQGGYDEASLTSLSTADFSCVSPLIKRVMEKLRPRNVSLSVSSLRAYGLDEDLLDELASVRATGLTFAPEAGTQRMRDVINKNISEEDIFTTCHRVFSRAWNRVKLYFMIGLPTEEEVDVLGIAAMGRQAVEIGRHYGRKAEVTVSVSSHVPKPHTPFQWCAMDDIPSLERKQGLLAGLSRRDGFSFRRHDVRVSHLEGIVSRGDRRTGDLIELAWRKGARFDGWDEHLKWDAWQEALGEWEAAWQVSRHAFLATLPLDGRLPWDHIDVGLAPGFLAKEYKKALVNRLSPPCGKPFGAKVHHTNLADAEADKRLLICYHCGVACDMTQMRQERKDFLSTLGAVERPVTRMLATERAQAQKRFRKGLTPREFDHGEKARYRLHYVKLGQVALMGHLDVVRMLPRIFRRARIELCYSQGFHPKPMVSYGPALSLGIASVAEYADVVLVRGVGADELVERFNAVAPEGLKIVAARRLGSADAKLSRVLEAQDFLLTVEEAWLAEKDSEPRVWLQHRCEEILDCESLPLFREKRGGVQLDARPALFELAVQGVGDWSGTLDLTNPWGVQARIAVAEDGPVPQPRELAQIVFGRELSHAAIARVGMWARGADGAWVEPMAIVGGVAEMEQSYPDGAALARGQLGAG